MYRSIAAAVLMGLISAQAQAEEPAPLLCNFDKDKLTYAGNPIEQATCLLRTVRKGADLDPPASVLPRPFGEFVDQRVTVSETQLRAYLKAKKIGEMSVGGSLDQSLSRGRDNDPKAPLARYFVIHDTSFPLPCLDQTFPADIDEPTWTGNKLSRYEKSGQAHLYITRDGQSISAGGRTFKDAWRATQAEKPSADTRAKGMFLHIENVQPRLVDPDLKQDATLKPNRQYFKWSTDEKAWVCRNDSIAPQPGVSAAQLDRLALVYIAASVRRGRWMIPAFHAVVDKHVPGGHDDPQNFDLADWGARICTQLEAMGGSCTAAQK